MSKQSFHYPISVAGKPFVIGVTVDVEAAPPEDTTPPAQPTGLVADGSSGTAILLDWDDNGEGDLAGYSIFRAPHATTAWVLLNPAGLRVTSEFTDASADPDVHWDYYVSATDTAGNESEGSAIADATRSGPVPDDPPAAVQGLTATPTYNGIALNWDDNLEVDLLGYRVYTADNPDGPYVLRASVAVSLFTDTTAPEGVVVFYRVTATDNAGNESTAVDIAAERPVPPMGTPILISSQGTMSPATIHVFATEHGGRRYYKPKGPVVPGITLANGTPLTSRYRWRFYEQDAATPNGSFPDLDGFNAAHVFENNTMAAKNFVVTMDITQANGAVLHASRTITVQPDRRTAVYVDNENYAEGSPDTGDGSSGNPFKTLARAFAAVTLPDRKVLIARSTKKYSLAATCTIREDNTLVDVFTPPARDPSLTAEVYWVGPKSGSMFKVSDCENVTLRNFVVSVANPIFNVNANPSLIDSSNGSVNITVTNIQTGAGLWSLYAQTTAPVDPPSGVLLQNCVCPARSLSGYLAYIVGANWVILGNSVLGAGQHCIRVGGCDNVLAAFNTFNRPKPPEDTVLSRGTITDHVGQYHYFTRNSCSGGDLSAGPLNTTVSDAADRTKWVVFDRNESISQADNNSGHFCGFLLHHGAEQVMIRNNHVRHNDWRSVELEAFSSQFSRGCVDVFVYNNTFENTGTSGKGLKLNGAATRVRYRNNLYLARNLTVQGRNAEIFGDSMGSFDNGGTDARKPVDRNVWPPTILSNASPQAPTTLTFSVNVQQFIDINAWKAFSQVGDDLGEFTQLQSQAGGGTIKPMSTSGAATYGRPISGVWEDYYGVPRSRTAANWAAGAAQP